MGEIRKIQLPLDPDLAAEVDAAIASGEYLDLNELVADTLAMWRAERLQHDPREIERIRALIQEGLDSGEPIEGNFDFEDIKRRGMARIRQEGRL